MKLIFRKQTKKHLYEHKSLMMIYLFLLIVFGQSCSKAENNKQLYETTESIVVTEEKLDDVELLGRVWGFMKYYHPLIAKGRYDWDAELLKILPDYIKTNNNIERDELLVEWINGFGAIAHNKATSVDSNAVVQPDLDWVYSSHLSQHLRNKLVEIFDNRCQKHNYYAKTSFFGADNIIITNEKEYSEYAYPPLGLRLISIFRYWNVIYYFYPYKYLTDKDWNLVLQDHLLDFINAKNDTEYRVAIMKLVAEINDSHASIPLYNTGRYQAAYEVSFIENELLVKGYYCERMCDTGLLKIGDVITMINGQCVPEIIDSLSPFISASNRGGLLRQISYFALRSDTNMMRVKYHSADSVEHDVCLELPLADDWINDYYSSNSNPILFERLDNKIGYVNLNCGTDDNINAIIDSIMNTDAVILDIRDGISISNSRLNYLVENMLGSDDRKPFVKFSKANVKTPGEFVGIVGNEIRGISEGYVGRIALLIGAKVQSRDEFFLMKMQQNPNVVLIGHNTAGADGNVSSVFFPGGIKTIFSGLGVYYPDGSETQRIGIVPDYYVEPTVQGIRNRTDEVLEKAKEIIMK